MFSALIRRPKATDEGKLREDLRLALEGWEQEQKALDRAQIRIADLEATISKKMIEADSIRAIADEREQTIISLRLDKDRLTASHEQIIKNYDQVCKEKVDQQTLTENTLKELTATKNRNEVLNSQVEARKERIEKMEKFLTDLIPKIEDAIGYIPF